MLVATSQDPSPGAATSICDNVDGLVTAIQDQNQDKTIYEQDDEKLVLLVQSFSSGQVSDVEEHMGVEENPKAEDESKDMLALDFGRLESSIVRQLDGISNSVELEFGSEILGSLRGMQGMQEYFDGVNCTDGAV